jgi:hypothetical protein
MDRATCPNCQEPLDDPYLIMCPKCRTVLTTHEQSQHTQQALLTDHKELLVRELERRALKRLLRWIGFGFALLGAIAGIGLWQIYTGLTTLVTNRIAEQFEEPRIRATLTEVAKTRASEIIGSSPSLRPASKLPQETEKHTEHRVLIFWAKSWTCHLKPLILNAMS